MVTDGYCRAVGEVGEKMRQNLSGREGRVTPAGCNEGVLHGETCRKICFFYFFYCFKQKQGEWVLLVRHG